MIINNPPSQPPPNNNGEISFASLRDKKPKRKVATAENFKYYNEVHACGPDSDTADGEGNANQEDTLVVKPDSTFVPPPYNGILDPEDFEPDDFASSSNRALRRSLRASRPLVMERDYNGSPSSPRMRDLFYGRRRRGEPRRGGSGRGGNPEDEEGEGTRRSPRVLRETRLRRASNAAPPEAGISLQSQAGPSNAQSEAGPSNIQSEAGPSNLHSEAGPSNDRSEAGPSNIQSDTGPSNLHSEAGPSSAFPSPPGSSSGAAVAQSSDEESVSSENSSEGVGSDIVEATPPSSPPKQRKLYEKSRASRRLSGDTPEYGLLPEQETKTDIADATPRVPLPSVPDRVTRALGLRKQTAAARDLSVHVPMNTKRRRIY